MDKFFCISKHTWVSFFVGIFLKSNLSFGHMFITFLTVSSWFLSFCFVWTHTPQPNLGLALLGGPSGGTGTSSTGLQRPRESVPYQLIGEESYLER